MNKTIMYIIKTKGFLLIIVKVLLSFLNNNLKYFFILNVYSIFVVAAISTI